MSNKIIDLENSYSVEIQRIKYILTSLENGRIYELTEARGDGRINTEITKLKKELNELFNKIQYGKKSNSDKLNDLF